MVGMTEAFVSDACKKLEGLKPDTPGAWGELKAEEVVPHLIGTFKRSMKQIPDGGFQGNWFTKTILRRIALSGVMGPPKNIKSYDGAGNLVPAVSAPGDLNTLRDLMIEFIEGERAGSLDCNPHPLFGDIGARGWSTIHYLHCKHHMKQFGIR